MKFGRTLPAIVLLAAASLALAFAAVPARADFAEGLRAFDAGDYATTLRQWRRAAEQGDTEAQVGFAGLYAAGLGVLRSEPEAAKWYARAARRGDAVGQLNLGDMYAAGRGVRRDLVAAYVWLSRAAAQGREWAARRRDQIALAMTSVQIGEAKARLGSC